MSIMSELADHIQTVILTINFSALLIVFIGGLYIAVHARNIPIWFRTSLWYIGATSFLICASIICEWTIGNSFFLSYSNFGLFGETLLNVNLAIASGLMLMHTLAKDIRCMKMRKKSNKELEF